MFSSLSFPANQQLSPQVFDNFPNPGKKTFGSSCFATASRTILVTNVHVSPSGNILFGKVSLLARCSKNRPQTFDPFSVGEYTLYKKMNCNTGTCFRFHKSNKFRLTCCAGSLVSSFPEKFPATKVSALSNDVAFSYLSSLGKRGKKHPCRVHTLPVHALPREGTFSRNCSLW